MLKKKIIYISLFTIFGILLSTLVHFVVEIFYIGLLIDDFEKFGLGLTWSNWYTIHTILLITLFIIGAVFGFFQGEYWWKIIYEKSYLSRLRSFFRNIIKR